MLMLRYGAEVLNIKQFQAKIKMSNVASQRMFLKIGFTETSRSEVFREITYTCNADSMFLEWLQENAKWSLDNYSSSAKIK